MTLENKIKSSKWKRTGTIANNIITGSLSLALVVGIGAFGLKTCYEMFPGEETNARVVKTEYRPEIDIDGVYMGINASIIYLDQDNRCLEIVNYNSGSIIEGDILKRISWDFNLVPWRCNEVDEYEKFNH